jgi:hypothetical protein
MKSRIADWLHNHWSYFLVMMLFPLIFGFILVVIAFSWILVYIFANYWLILLLLFFRQSGSQYLYSYFLRERGKYESTESDAKWIGK